jgi:hypothetical protein
LSAKTPVVLFLTYRAAAALSINVPFEPTSVIKMVVPSDGSVMAKLLIRIDPYNTDSMSEKNIG